jgi:hypothetical protein
MAASFGIINCGGDDTDASNSEDGGVDSPSGSNDGSALDASKDPGDDAGGSQDGGDAGGPQDGGDAGDAQDGGDADVEPVDHTWANWHMPNPVAAALPNPASYTASADVVVDNVTGLQWQRVLSDSSVTWQVATDYCADLTLGGYSDWRLPTLIELYSLVDFTASSPSIDVVTFPGTPAENFWTSTPLGGDPTQDFTINFGTPYTNVKPVTETVFVRCVR